MKRLRDETSTARTSGRRKKVPLGIVRRRCFRWCQRTVLVSEEKDPGEPSTTVALQCT